MADDIRKEKWQNFLEAVVRETVREQLGFTQGEIHDAEAFLAIPHDPCEKCGFIYDYLNQTDRHICGSTEAPPPPLAEGFHGRWENLSYDDHVFLYDLLVSCEENTHD